MAPKTIAEKELWANQAADVAKEVQPLVHTQRFAFNYGFHMGVEVMKMQSEQKLRDFMHALRQKGTYEQEIRIMEIFLRQYEKFGDREVEVE